MLLLLTILATLLVPLARPIHEAIESSSLAAVGTMSHRAPPSPHAPLHHDPTHCATCAAIDSLKQIAVVLALVFSLTCECAPEFILPTYLAPATHEPTLTLIIPRGPPLASGLHR